MAVDYTPTLGNYTELKPFRYWCQKVLPLVYDDSLSYYELLCKVVDYLNKTMEDVETLNDDVEDLHDAYEQLQAYVNNYFDNLNVQTEINNKLDDMATDGTLDGIIAPHLEHYQQELDLLDARLTNLETAFPAGGTSADAELVDIRVAYDGTTYDSAGDAVRGQVSGIIDMYAPIYSVLTIEADTNTWVDSLNLTANKTIKITNNSSERVVLGFYASDKTTSLQSSVEVVRNTTAYVTVNQFTYYLLVYSPSGATGQILIENVDARIPVIENSLRMPLMITPSQGATHWINYPLIYGKTYTLINNSNNYISADGYAINKTTKLVNIGQVLKGESITFTAEANSYYLLIYCASATLGEIIFYENNTVTGRIEELANKINSPIVVGATGDYQTVKEGMEVANSLNRELVILPGTYDLVSEGITGIGYIAPKKIYGYGATLTCHLADENWNLSPLNINKSTEIYGLTIIASNCRYCVHDDRGNESNVPYYHNIYKDCHFVHQSQSSATLLQPKCIGGGLGDTGDIEILNCIFESHNDDVTYHSLSTVSQRPQTGEFKIFIDSCYFTNTPNCSGYGTSTDYVNKMYVCNCSVGESVPVVDVSNMKLIGWNNSVRS